MKIGLLYSRGPHFMRVLKSLRQAAPDAHITALVPPGFPEPPLEGLADEVRVMERPGGLGGASIYLRGIRAGRFDRFVVLFDSPRLRVLAALSGARERTCHTIEGRRLPLGRAVIRPLMGAGWRGLCGRIRYARIRWIVRHRPVAKRRR